MYRSYRRILPLFYLIVCLNKLLVITSEQCIPVGQCSDEQISGLQLGRLSYEIAASNQNAVQVCPRSDLGIPHWEVLFTSGNFCSAVNFSSSIVCNNDGSLVFFDLTGFYNTSGSLLFNVTVLNATLEVLYAPTRVYHVTNPVFFEYNQKRVDLMWFVYHPNPRPEIRTYHNGEIISVDQTPVNISLYGAFIDETMCERSTSTEITVVYSLYIHNPNPTSAGEYILVADSFSMAITLIIDPSSIPNASTDIFSSSMPEPGSSQTPSVTTSNSRNDFILFVTIIPISVVLLVGLIIVIGVVVCCLIRKLCTRQKRDEEYFEEQEQMGNVHNPKYRTQNGVDQPNTVINEAAAAHHNEQRRGVHNPIFRQHESEATANDLSTIPSNNGSTTTPVDVVDSNLSANVTDNASTPSAQQRPSPLQNQGIADALIGEIKGLRSDLRNQHMIGNDQRDRIVDELQQIHVMQSDQLEVQQNMAGQLEDALVNEEDPNTHLNIGGSNASNGDQSANRTVNSSAKNTESNVPSQPTERDVTDEHTSNGDQDGMLTNGGDHVPGADQSDHDQNNNADQPLVVNNSGEDSDILERGPCSEQSQFMSEDPPCEDNRPTGAESSTNCVHKLHEEPNFGRFMELVGNEIIDKWESFGGMVGLSTGELGIIHDCQDVHFRFSHVLNKWKQKYYKEKPFTWESVIRILRSMEIHSVADTVIKSLNGPP